MIITNRTKIILPFLVLLSSITNILGTTNSVDNASPAAAAEQQTPATAQPTPVTQASASEDSTPAPTDTMSQAEMEEVKQQMIQQYESILKVVLHFLDIIDTKLEELASVVGLDKLKVKDKAATLREVKAMREIVMSVKKQALASADPMTIKVALDVSKALAVHLIKALEQKFHDVQPFDVAAVVTRTAPDATELTPEKLAERVDKAKVVFEKFEKDAKSAGLYWYNKLFRSIDDTCSAIWKHKIGGVVPVGLTVTLGALTAATAFYWLKFANPHDNGLITIPFTDWSWDYRPWLGTPYVSASEKISDGDGAPGLIATPNHFIYTAAKHSVGAALTGTTMYYAYSEWDEIKEWYQKTYAAVYNWFRGGASNYKYETEARIEPRYTFKDAIGLKRVKDQLGIFVKYLEDPENFDRSNLQPEKGILFTGDTRTGKSFMAECLAGEIQAMLKEQNRADKIGFYVISANLINKKGISYLLEIARREAPCILFIDEIDLLRLQRDRDSTLLSEFLSTMSGCLDGNTQKLVILIGATNKPNNMDSALLQHGRFSWQIPFEYPTFEERKFAIEKKLDNFAVNPAHFDVERLARELEGSSFKDIDVMLTSAFQKARQRGQVFSPELLEESFDESIRKLIDSDLNVPLDEQYLLAVHQAGHALAHKWFDSHEQLSKVTIKKYIPKVREQMVYDKYYQENQKLVEYGKVFTHHTHDRAKFDTQEEKINQCKILLAGNVAEKVIFGSTSHSYHKEDKQLAHNIIKSIVFENMRPEELSKTTNNKLLDECRTRLAEIEAQVTKVFEERKDSLMVISAALQHMKTVTNEDIDMILEFRRQELAGTLPKEIMEMKAKAEKEMMEKMEKEHGLPPAPMVR